LVAFASSTAIPRNYVHDFEPPRSALNSDEPHPNALSTNVNLLAVEMWCRDALYEAQTLQVSMLSEQLHQSCEENLRTRAQLTMTLTRQLLDSPTQQDCNARARHDYTQASLPLSRVDTQTVHMNEAGAATATDKHCLRSRNLTTPIQTIKV
jgi:hypothetical protein